MEGNKELLEAMEMCGHFLYHRRGGKRGQKRILHILYSEGEISQKQLQNILDIKAGSLSEIAIKLESCGFIKRKKDERDKRNIIIEITEAGKVEYERMQVVNSQQEKVLFQGLTMQEQTELLELLDHLLSDWKENFGDILERHGKGRPGKGSHEMGRCGKEEYGKDGHGREKLNG